MKVLLSIKPEYVKEIMNGRKKYEYRKRIFKNKEVDTIIIYATKPIGKVIGEFEVGNILEEEPKRLWKRTKFVSGISKNNFDEYFKDTKNGFAIEIKRFTPYVEPLELVDLDRKIKHAPQSFMYVF